MLVFALFLRRNDLYYFLISRSHALFSTKFFFFREISIKFLKKKFCDDLKEGFNGVIMSVYYC